MLLGGNSITALETGGRGVVWFSSTLNQLERCKRNRVPTEAAKYGSEGGETQTEKEDANREVSVA